MARDTYLSIDLDVLSASALSGRTSTPAGSGLEWTELLELVAMLFDSANVIACDVVELCPIAGMASPNFIAAKLVYKVLTYKFGRPR